MFGRQTLDLLAPLLIAGAIFVSGSGASAAPAAQSAPHGDLSIWEQKMLGKTYEQDPIDKRIQRLELLLFGGTQEGSLTERLTQIRTEIAARPSVHVSKATVADALNQLEQKILKKTYAAEMVEARLSRLETKLFGKSSPSMSSNDRIDRLKRTIGLGESPPIAQSDGNNFLGQVPFSTRDFPGGGPMMIPFGADGNMSPTETMRQMDQMFKQLNQQLRSLHKMPAAPHMAPVPFGEMPNFQFKTMPQGKDEQLPPYSDPNSI